MSTKPVTFNNGVQTTFGEKRGLNEVGLSTGDFGSNLGGLKWYNSLDPSSQYVIYSNTYDVGLGDMSSARPIFWQTNDKSDVNLLKIINGLPGRRGMTPFTIAAEAIGWVNSSTQYYFLKPTGNKTWVYIVNVSYSNNYFYAVLNYTTNTATLIDSGIDATVWSEAVLFPTTDFGYAANYYDNSNGYKKVQFINDNGSIIGDYTTSVSTNWYLNDYDGKWLVFNDETNGVFNYFNGINNYQYNYDPSYQSVSILWWYDSTTSDNYALLQVNNSNTNNNDTYIINSFDGSLSASLRTWNSSDFNVTYATTVSSDFIVEWVYSNSTNKYIELCILDPTLAVPRLAVHDLTGFDYTAYTFNFFGSNKMHMIFHNGSDVNVDYGIYTYNSATNISHNLTHPRGVDYVNINFWSRNNYGVDYYKHEMALVSFNSNSSDYEDYGYNYFTNQDFIFFTEDNTPVTYSFATNQTSGTKTRGLKEVFKGAAIFLEVKMDGSYGILTFKNDGTNYFESIGSASSIDNSYSDVFGDKFLVAPFLQNDRYSNTLYNETVHVLNSSGTTIDSFTFTGDTGSNVNLSFEHDYNVLYVKNDNTYKTQNKYFNDSNVFTDINYYDYAQNTNTNYVDDTYKTSGRIVLINTTRGVFNVINQTGISGEFNFPSDYVAGFDLNLGINFFQFIYAQNIENYGIVLYDFNGNVLQTLSVPGSDNINRQTVSKNTSLVEMGHVDGTYTLYMMSPTDVKSVSYNNSIDRTINDIITWWC